MSKNIGIVGGGQLGRMLAEAAHALGFTVTVLDPTPQSPAGQVADKQIVGDFKDESKIRELAAESDFLTFEIELANNAILAELAAKGLPVNPAPKTLAMIKDKFSQKKFLRDAGIPVADFTEVRDIEEGGAMLGYPFVLKAKFDAYDGRGNALVESEAGIEAALAKLANRPSAPLRVNELYAEKFVSFVKELAVVAVRSMEGEIAVYPVVETIHTNHICHEVLAPAPVPQEVARQAEDLARKTLEHLSGAGVFGLEMFWVPQEPTPSGAEGLGLSGAEGLGEVLINEIAPRVHNSGHFTIEACETSQFENHIRAITGLPLGSTAMKVPAAVMINILGERTGPAKPEGIEVAEALGGVGVHIYGKVETKLERKMGHLTAIGDELEEVKNRAAAARKLIAI